MLKNGAEIAEPGEFTKRAFLNGRMDLSQAEAVMDVIQAKNEYALRSSMDQLRGSVQKAIRDIREKLIYHIAYIESALDDPEHISLDGYPQELLEVVDNEQKEVKRLLKTSSDGKMIQEGIQTVILGKPNAGKSSQTGRMCQSGNKRSERLGKLNLHGIIVYDLCGANHIAQKSGSLKSQLLVSPAVQVGLGCLCVKRRTVCEGYALS